MQYLKSLSVLVVWTFVQTRCITASPTDPGSCGVVTAATVLTFAYTPLLGPLNWDKKIPDCGLCRHGKHQSPILLDDSVARTTPGSLIVTPGNLKAPLRLENKSTTVQVSNANATLTVRGHDYALQNYHFHTPSEHRVNLEYSPVEMHVVFQDASKQRAVLGFLIELSDQQETLSKFVRSTLARVGCISVPGTAVEVSPRPLFHDIAKYVHRTSFYSYEGSLTTPPCTESVKWFVGTKKLRLDLNTYNALKAVVKFNSRFSQTPPGSADVIQAECS